MNKKELKLAGKKLQDHALKLYAKDIKGWLKSESILHDRYEMLKQTGNDMADLIEIGQRLIEGNVEEAAEIAYELDTIVREEIPNRLWNYLLETACNA